jgi:hypothetical protein
VCVCVCVCVCARARTRLCVVRKDSKMFPKRKGPSVCFDLSSATQKYDAFFGDYNISVRSMAFV